MATFTTADVKRLRELTAAGMMDCKKALEEADGDFDKAVELLRIKGAKDVGKRAERTTANGLVAAATDDGVGVLVEVKCETDFVAKGERFQELGRRIVQAALTTETDDPAVLLDAVVDGRSVRDLVEENSAALGEKIELGRLARFAGAAVVSYLHKTSPDLPPQLGVLVELSAPNAEAGKDIAQHIAAFAPRYLTRADVPEDVVAAERRIAEATAREEGKPEQALPKIVEGRVTGFFKETVLTEQAFAKDPKKTVQQVLDDAGVRVVRFARFRIGQL
ncbi:translation elongation factor Ts (EF-Ts) [Acidothermus cellulolyticus 11B]|jgi:elongation factor Ts|uniref:Elongation factor Ts n=1 Tax=Acidothermus cellulolyticus (strain ATCC 43068 / DSM 8971 / 11B) TaxID=351607 RepID=EFTS_ACIC1|nr:translation elongation factor Ts [Acidothermus cellulolyticus]A0LV53.1 RecName: Full=Elongation factor Ts; Short=EF-Ts [Acidothermus cellulolyticus 11B]ABK53313.1 translation elongation factor Ts (EF-Ts) [Acidothermus cellulolyticus 11B]